MPSIIDAFRLNPRLLANTVFKYLDYSPELNGIPVDATKAMIACTARSGSSYLQVALRRYDFNFQEFLNTEGHVKRFVQGGGERTTSAFATSLASEVQNGLLGLKIPYSGITYLTAMREFPDRADEWSIVFLVRRNHVRQAISRHIATITQKWTATMPGTRDVTADDYDFDALLEQLEGIVGENSRWEGLFAKLGLSPLRIVYEDILADEDAMLARIASWLSRRELAPVTAEVALTRQATSLNDDWEGRFLEDFRQLFRSSVDELQEISKTAQKPRR